MHAAEGRCVRKPMVSTLNIIYSCIQFRCNPPNIWDLQGRTFDACN